MKTAKFLWLPILGLGALACGDSFPIPDEFDAAFTVGQICAPQSIATSDGAHYPMRLELCLYRCVSIDRSTAEIRSFYQCAGDQCQMTILASAHAHKVTGQENCDARDLVNPPEGECTNTIIDFDVSVPTIGGAVKEGTFAVTIPYLELDQGQKVLDRIDKGDDPNTVIQEEVGTQNYPSRQFQLVFSKTATPVTDHDSLTGGDCHTIGAP